MNGNRAQDLKSILGRASVVRARDLEALGLPRSALKPLLADGTITRETRGLYSVSASSVTEYHSLAQVGKRVPGGVVCLLSALVFHGLTTQTPHEVWLALDRKARKPALDYPPARVVRFGGLALSQGAAVQNIEGVPVRITGPAKTVADCFKYRNKIGVAVAVEALQDAWRRKLFTMDQLWQMAKICRVANVMRPYLETLS